MTEITKFTKYVTNYCPNLPTFVFSQAFTVAGREYFKATQAWSETLTVSVVPGQSEIDLFKFTADSDIEAIDEVRLDLVPMAYLQTKPADTKEGKPCYFYTKSKRCITVYPVPKEAQTLIVEVRLVPKVGAERFPGSVFAEHFEGLVAGTVANLKRMTGTEWFDPNGASEFYNEFHRHIDTKRMEIEHGHTNAELTISYPSFT
jgi:hypothetical protein